MDALKRSFSAARALALHSDVLAGSAAVAAFWSAWDCSDTNLSKASVGPFMSLAVAALPGGGAAPLRCDSSSCSGEVTVGAKAAPGDASASAAALLGGGMATGVASSSPRLLRRLVGRGSLLRLLALAFFLPSLFFGSGSGSQSPPPAGTSAGDGGQRLARTRAASQGAPVKP